MLTLLELEYGQCKFPVSGDVPEQRALCNDMPFGQHFFCGDPVAS